MRDAWLEEVLRTARVKDACRVLLIYMATARDGQGRYFMTESGRIRVSRERLAAALDVNPKRITDRITEATRAGLLIKVGGGYHGQVSQYLAQLVGDRKVPVEPAARPAVQSLARLVKLPGNGGPSESEEPVPSRGNEPLRTATKGSAEPAPHARACARATYEGRDSVSALAQRRPRLRTCRCVKDDAWREISRGSRCCSPDKGTQSPVRD